MLFRISVCKFSLLIGLFVSQTYLFSMKEDDLSEKFENLAIEEKETPFPHTCCKDLFEAAQKNCFLSTSIFTQDSRIDIDMEKSQDEGTALHSAIFHNFPDVVKLLVEHGADLSKKYKYLKKTDQQQNWRAIYMNALELAAFYGHARIVALLIPCMMEKDLKISSALGFTIKGAQEALYYKAFPFKKKVEHFIYVLMELMVNGGNPFFCKNKDGYNGLQCAIDSPFYGRCEIVEFFLTAPFLLTSTIPFKPLQLSYMCLYKENFGREVLMLSLILHRFWKKSKIKVPKMIVHMIFLKLFNPRACSIKDLESKFKIGKNTFFEFSREIEDPVEFVTSLIYEPSIKHNTRTSLSMVQDEASYDRSFPIQEHFDRIMIFLSEKRFLSKKELARKDECTIF